MSTRQNITGKGVKLFVIGLAALSFSLSICRVSRASDFSIPRVQPGELVSADVFNMVLGYIEDAKKMLTVSSLVGEWSCVKYVAQSNNHPSYYPNSDVRLSA